MPRTLDLTTRLSLYGIPEQFFKGVCLLGVTYRLCIPEVMEFCGGFILEARTDKGELVERAKNIPANVLKRISGLRGTKAVIIREMAESDAKTLQVYADHYTLNRRKSLFVFRTRGGLQLRLDDPRFLDTVNDRLKSILPKEGRFEIQRISVLDERGEAILNVRYETDPHTDHQWDGPPHVHRPPRIATVGIPLDGRYMKIHTRSPKKARQVSMRLGKALYGAEEAAELIVLDKEDIEKKFGETRAQIARITNLDLAGAKEIIVKGSDVEGALFSLKEDYGLDFEAMKASIEYDRIADKEVNVRMGQDGKVTFKSAKIDRDGFIVERLLE